MQCPFSISNPGTTSQHCGSWTVFLFDEGLGDEGVGGHDVENILVVNGWLIGRQRPSVQDDVPHEQGFLDRSLRTFGSRESSVFFQN